MASDGSVYVADAGNDRIQKFTSEGVFVSKWITFFPVSIAVSADGSVYVVNELNPYIQKFTSEGVFVSNWGTDGTGDGEFNDPNGIATSPDGRVYIADSGNNRIKKSSVGPSADAVASCLDANRDY